MKQTVQVVEYDPLWPEIFAQVSGPVRQALDGIVLRVEHVGSTSVPGLAAKPVIDLSVVVPSEREIAPAVARLATLGYQHQGTLGIAGREAFRRPPDTFPHHLYVCPENSPGLQNHLGVRDYLRTHPETARAYGALKQRLAAEFPHDIDAYVAGKTDFLLAILRESGFAPEALTAIEQANKGE